MTKLKKNPWLQFDFSDPILIHAKRNRRCLGPGALQRNLLRRRVRGVTKQVDGFTSENRGVIRGDHRQDTPDTGIIILVYVGFKQVGQNKKMGCRKKKGFRNVF